jgi:hypothetical protein
MMLITNAARDGRPRNVLLFTGSGANENLMQRRTFISALGVVALTGSHPAAAQQAGKAPHIGFLAMDLTSGNRQFREVFFEGLRDLGYVEDRNLVIEPRCRGETGPVAGARH